MDYFFIVVLIIILPIFARVYVTSSYKRYSETKTSSKLSGCEIARKILDKNGLQDVHVVKTNGILSDHYDPVRKVVRLSSEIFDSETIASNSVAAHECGHAIQDKNNYVFFKIRSFIFPIVNFTSRFAYIFIILGFILEFIELLYLGIGIVAFGIIFQLITLPLEFNASSIAKTELQKLHLCRDDEIEKIKKMLNSAAFTYVASAITSILQLLRLVLLSRRD